MDMNNPNLNYYKNIAQEDLDKIIKELEKSHKKFDDDIEKIFNKYGYTRDTSIEEF